MKRSMFPMDPATLVQQTHRVRDAPPTAGCSLCDCGTATAVECAAEAEVVGREWKFEGLLPLELPKVAALDQSGVLRLALLEVLGGEGLFGLFGCGLAVPAGDGVPLSLIYCERGESDELECLPAEEPG